MNDRSDNQIGIDGKLEILDGKPKPFINYGPNFIDKHLH